MYEDIVKQMREIDKQLEANKQKVARSRENGLEDKENEQINKELKARHIKTIDINDLMEITGATYGRKFKKK